MKTLLEALIGKHNVSNAHALVSAKVLKKFTKKDLITGDMIILKDKSIGMFVRGEDLKDSDDFVSQQYECKNGIIIFPNWYRKDNFEYCNIDDYNHNLTTYTDFVELSVKYVIKGIIDPNLRKNKHMFWSFINDKSNYDELLPYDVLEFIEWN